MIKSALKKLIGGSVSAMGRTGVGRLVYAEIVSSAMARSKTASRGEVELAFATPNRLNVYRAETFATKEPETLEWIDSIPSGSIFWDIGGNVGLYSCYAAKRGCTVFVFEPSVFNLELLARNVFLNGLIDRVTIIPLPLSDSIGISTLNMTSTQWGGAMSTFGRDFGHDGKPMQKLFEFRTVGLSMVDAVEKLGIAQPDYIKMDVDGIEHLILKGGGDVLRRATGILVEINDAFSAQAEEAAAVLRGAGFSLREKRHADEFDADDSAAKHTFNQIWSR